MLDNKIFEKMTIHAKNSLKESESIARFFGSNLIYSEHLLFAILLEEGCLGSNILKDLGIKKEHFEKILPVKKTATAKKSAKSLDFSAELKKIITRAYLFSNKFNYSYIGTEHLVFSIIEVPNQTISQILSLTKITDKNSRFSKEKLEKKVFAAPINGNLLDKSFLSGIFKSLNIPAFGFPPLAKSDNQSSTTPNLDYFCTNLNKKVKKENAVLVGRDEEMERIFNSLGRKSKNNPMLIGDPGIGKTAIVEGLAQKINSGNVPPYLLNKKILALDLALVVAGTNFRGEFEQRLKDILDEASANKNIIIFIDEIHGIVGAGNASGGLDAANILKPLLTQGSIRCIGATTLEEYKKYIEKDPALERRFQPIILKEPSKKDTLKILEGVKKNYEKFHHINISKEALASAVELSSHYIFDRFQPDKSIDLIDETSARIKSQIINPEFAKKIRQLENDLEKLIDKKHSLINTEKYDEAIGLRKKEEQLIEKIAQVRTEQKEFYQKNKITITAEDIAKTVSKITGIPETKISSRQSETILKIKDKLNQSVIGQSEAIEKIYSAILRSQSGVSDSNKPMGSFLFLGPSGVGKTLCAKILAREFFDNESALLKIDMSEFGEKHNISRLLGAPAGYVGYGEGGKLTEKIRRQPYTLILFDEIEKAHPDVFNILLQILEEGVLTDAEGRRVNFRNTIIILTSNIGTKEFTRASGIGFSSQEKSKSIEKEFDSIRQKVLDELKEKMKPEILNRLDNIIVFNPLTQEDFQKITELEIKKLSQRLSRRHIKLSTAKKVTDFIGKKSYSSEKGARNIKEILRNELEDIIAQKIMSAKLPVNKISINIQKDKIVVK